MQLSKILLPVDFSERSAGAAHYAKALACRFRSELSIAHVFELQKWIIAAPEGGVPAGWYDERREETQRALMAFHAEEFRNMPVRHALLKGDVATAIVDHAHSEHAD